MSMGWIERIGCLIAAAGLVWGVKVVTENFRSIANLSIPTGGPVELCGLGVVVWSWAKYRRSVVVH